MRFVLSSATVPSTIERSTRIVSSPRITSSRQRPTKTSFGLLPRTITRPVWCRRRAIESPALLVGPATLARSVEAASVFDKANCESFANLFSLDPPGADKSLIFATV